MRTLGIVRRLTGCFYCGLPCRGDVCSYCSDLPLRDPLVSKARQPLTEQERMNGHDADAAMAVMRGADFLVAEGYPPGAVVTFSHAIAADPHFQDALARVELRDLQPPAAQPPA